MKVYIAVLDNLCHKCRGFVNRKVFDTEKKAWAWIKTQESPARFDVETWEVI